MKVVFVVGPTASGKSKAALAWAQEFQGAIVNCDSVQVYKGLDIGSAKPTREEIESAPHFLFDYVSKGQILTAGDYTRDFFAVAKQLEKNVPVIFVVGGTGFYFQAIEKGMYEVGAADPEMQKQVEEELLMDPEGVYRELQEKDPEAAKNIKPNDHYRIGRAVEMMRTHGKSVTEVKAEFEKQKKDFPYPLLKIGFRGLREDLRPRIETRTEQMLNAGLVQEVEGLLKEGLREWSPLASVGYKEVVAHLNGELKKEDLKEAIITSTLQLAKKQRTWFQRDDEINWSDHDQKLAAFIGRDK